MGRIAPEIQILTASLVKFWILAKIARQALPHKA